MRRHHHSPRRKLIIAVCVLLAIIICIIGYNYYQIKKEGIHFKRMVYPIRAVFEHHKNLGITANQSLDYPRIPIGTAVTRDIMLNNIYGFRVRIVPSAEGNVTPYIISSMEPVLLETGEMEKFNVTIHAKGESGNYTGNLTLDLYRII
jgi:hypothetical protein